MNFLVCQIMASYGLVGYVEVVVLDACICLIHRFVSIDTPDDNNSDIT